MIFHSIRETKGWTIIDYNSTWGYGYDFMLDAVQGVIDTDFKTKVKRIASAEVNGDNEVNWLEEARKKDFRLRSCDGLQEEKGSLVAAGISSIMELPLQIAFFNQTNIVRLYCPSAEFIQQHGEHVFDNYMNSIEINAYCRSARRAAIESFKKQQIEE